MSMTPEISPLSFEDDRRGRNGTGFPFGRIWTEVADVDVDDNKGAFVASFFFDDDDDENDDTGSVVFSPSSASGSTPNTTTNRPIDEERRRRRCHPLLSTSSSPPSSSYSRSSSSSFVSSLSSEEDDVVEPLTYSDRTMDYTNNSNEEEEEEELMGLKAYCCDYAESSNDNLCISPPSTELLLRQSSSIYRFPSSSSPDKHRKIIGTRDIPCHREEDVFSTSLELRILAPALTGTTASTCSAVSSCQQQHALAQEGDCYMTPPRKSLVVATPPDHARHLIGDTTTTTMRGDEKEDVSSSKAVMMPIPPTRRCRSLTGTDCTREKLGPSALLQMHPVGRGGQLLLRHASQNAEDGLPLQQQPEQLPTPPLVGNTPKASSNAATTNKSSAGSGSGPRWSIFPNKTKGSSKSKKNTKKSSSSSSKATSSCHVRSKSATDSGLERIYAEAYHQAIVQPSLSFSSSLGEGSSLGGTTSLNSRGGGNFVPPSHPFGGCGAPPPAPRPSSHQATRNASRQQRAVHRRGGSEPLSSRVFSAVSPIDTGCVGGLAFCTDGSPPRASSAKVVAHSPVHPLKRNTSCDIAPPSTPQRTQNSSAAHPPSICNSITKQRQCPQGSGGIPHTIHQPKRIVGIERVGSLGSTDRSRYPKMLISTRSVGSVPNSPSSSGGIPLPPCSVSSSPRSQVSSVGFGTPKRLFDGGGDSSSSSFSDLRSYSSSLSGRSLVIRRQTTVGGGDEVASSTMGEDEFASCCSSGGGSRSSIQRTKKVVVSEVKYFAGKVASPVTLLRKAAGGGSRGVKLQRSKGCLT